MNNWFDHILFHMSAQPEAPAMVMEDRVVTYGMLKTGIERCARRISALHLDRQGTVAVLVRNPVRHLTLCLALFRIGLRSISLEHGQSGIRELVFAAVLCERDASDTIDRRNRFIEVSDDWFSVDLPAGEPLASAFTDPMQVCRLSLTSGATGAPKIFEHPVEVVGTRMHRFSAINWRRLLSLPGPSSMWAYSMSCMALATGRTICFAESPFQAVRMIELFAIDFVVTSTEQLLALTRVARTSRAKLESLRTIVVGGSVPTQTLLERALIYLCNNIICRYGTSETGVLAETTAAEILSRPGFVGHVVPGVVLGIFDQNEHECPPGKIGTIRVRVDANDCAAAYAGTNEPWIDVGDVGWMDSERELYVLGRTSDVGGFGRDLSPIHEIEHLLRLEWDLADAAAVMAEAASDTETQPIWIGVVDNKDVTTEKLTALLRARGHHYAVKLFDLRSIPRGANGKVNRQQLKALMLEAGTKSATS